MRRPTAFLVSGLFALALFGGAGSLATVAPVSAATIAPTTTCNNGVGNPGGQGAVCQVTVVNTITPAGGSAVVTVRECTGSAGVPETACTNTTSPLSEPVTAVDQCNGSINGGGGVLLCSIVVTNNFVGITPSPTVTAVTVNQCAGSGTTGTVRVCDPDTTITGATINQCNGSANGGGTSLTCTASGTQSSGLTVLIRQCNASSNGGGTTTVCSATMTNNVIPAATPSPTPVPAPTATAAPTATPAPGAATPRPTPRPTAPNTSTAPLASGQSETAVLLVAGLAFLFAISILTVARRQNRSS